MRAYNWPTDNKNRGSGLHNLLLGDLACCFCDSGEMGEDSTLCGQKSHTPLESEVRF